MDASLIEQIPEPLRTRIVAEIERLELTNKLLREENRLLMILKYGSSSERLSDAQLLLLETEPGVSQAEVDAEAARGDIEKSEKPASKPRKKPVRGALPAHLPREERIVPCPEALCQCAQCGGLKKLIGYEVSERLSIKPVVLFVEVTKREKRACAKCEEMGVSVAPVPGSIVEKGIFSDRLVIDATLKKYCEHNPFYRQAQSLERETGLEISQSTLGSSVLHLGELFMPVCMAMRADLIAGVYIQADETTVGVQSERTKGRNHQAYLWEYGRPGAQVVYEFRMGREREGPKNFLANFGGKLQSDGYGAYDKIGTATLVHFGCWAHARRKFYEASKADPKEARGVAIVKAIAKLYAVESDAREAALSAADREALRLEKSVPQLRVLRAMIIEARAAALPQSALGKAGTYAINQWERLERYAAAGNGCVEIDNNRAENSMRGIALGRRNWIHIGSEKAGPKVASLLSIIETCRRLGMNARDYLEDVAPRLANWNSTRIAELTPMAWLAARTPAQPAGEATSAS